MNMKTVWEFIIKYEFWCFFLIVIALEFGDYQTGERWMGSLATVLLLIAVTRLASHPMWKKEET